MNWREHAPPHFDARYGDDEITVEIETGRVTGTMSHRAVGMVQEWREAHLAELLANWTLAEQRSPFNRISPLE